MKRLVEAGVVVDKGLSVMPPNISVESRVESMVISIKRGCR